MKNSQGIGMTSMRTRQRLVERLVRQGVVNSEVLNLIRNTPRHLFIEEALSHRAYEDKSLPIGQGQTISQPYIVAKMTELLLGNGKLNKVLEVGTGSGYQTAILSALYNHVYTTERIAALLRKAKSIHKDLCMENIYYQVVDGGMGLEAYAPFDGIISTCAPSVIPEALLSQLSPNGGRLVIPVGTSEQVLTVVDRNGDDYKYQEIEPVIFVPLISGVKDQINLSNTG